jgi:hypothetical protein
MKERGFIGEVYNNGEHIYGPLTFFADDKKFARDHLLHLALFAKEKRHATVRVVCLGWFDEKNLPTEQEALSHEPWRDMWRRARAQ